MYLSFNEIILMLCISFRADNIYEEGLAQPLGTQGGVTADQEFLHALRECYQGPDSK